MNKPEYPQVSCREPVASPAGMTYLCEIVNLHPGPCANLSYLDSVKRRDAWEQSHPGWEADVGTQDTLVDAPGPDRERSRAIPEITYRRFRVVEKDGLFLIVELPSTLVHPDQWTDGRLTKHQAWMQARGQHRPVSLILLNEAVRNLGVVVDL